MTQQSWGGPPDQWQRGQAPWAASFGSAPVQTPWPPPAQQPPAAPYAQGYAPQYYPQPGQFPPPQRPRRRGFFDTLLRAILTFVAIMVAISVIRGIITGLTRTTGGTVPTGGKTTATTGATPGSSTTTGTGTGTGTSGANGTTQYQNEGYQAPPADFNPPDLPQPTTVSEANSWLKSNVIYKGNVPAPTNCTMTAIQSGLTKAQLETRLNELMVCLMAVWEPPMKAAGFEMPRPPVTVYNSPVTTACGVMKDVNAAYCAGDQRVYYAMSLLNALPSKVKSTKYAVEVVIAHEFGHAVQGRTGILISDKALEQRATDSEATIMSRRTEQQADCFSALYVASVAQSQNLGQKDLQALVDMTYYLGDDVLSGDPNVQGDHGQGRNRQAWFARGVQTNQIGVCNTWVVPATQVR